MCECVLTVTYDPLCVRVGSALWMAPEVMRREAFNESIDVYAFGLIAWQIWTQKVLFERHTDLRVFANAVSVLHERPPLTADMRPSLQALLQVRAALACTRVSCVLLCDCVCDKYYERPFNYPCVLFNSLWGFLTLLLVVLLCANVPLPPPRARALP